MFLNGKTVRKIVSAILVGTSLLASVPALAVDYVGIGKVTGDAVNIRSDASTSSSIVGVEPFGTTIPAISNEINGWYQISYKDQSAWICGSYFQVSPVSESNSRGAVTGDFVNVRSGPGTEYNVISGVTSGTTLVVYGEENGWYKVSVGGQMGYISGNYFSTTIIVTGTKSNGGQAVVDEAMRHVGKAYVYGAEGPNSFDCSGLVQYVYKQFGYSLNRTAHDQLANGIPVQKSNLMPGDILFFSNNGSYMSHVGIYIGNNQMVHASTSRTGVIISNITDSYYVQRYAAARRIIN